MIVNVNELRVFGVNDLCEKLLGRVEVEDFDSSGVYKIEVGCRGEVEEVSKIDVVDGKFVVESKEEYMKRVLEEYDREDVDDYRKDLEYWVDLELIDGVLKMYKNEEDGFDVYRVEV